MDNPTLIANRYVVRRTLGQGAMGLVWQVQDQVTGADVALKVIAKEFGATDNAILQFKQEFRLMAQLRHPNCCAVYDYGITPDGEPYFTMEVVPGHGLDELLPLRGAEFERVLTQLLLALGYVHQQGFVHSDIKSANVRVMPDGTVKLMDFGLMEHAGRSGGPIKGTVGYIAPEIVKRGPVDQRTDLYAVGALAYELLTGQVPFLRPTALEVLRAHLNDRPTPPGATVPELDPRLERIVLKLLAKEPLERYQSAFEVLADLGAEVPAGLGGNLLSSPMVSREAELETLLSALEAVRRGESPGCLLLSGPPGVGKTRLVDEFRIRVQLESVLCATAAATEHHPLPYQPIVTVLKSLLPAVRERVPEALARHAPVLVKLLPELQVEAAPELDAPNKEKLRMQAAIAELLAALAQASPVVVILENWHWIDPLSAEVLAYMRRNAADAPLLVVLTSRTLPPVHEVSAASAGGSSLHEQVRPVPLAHLGPEGVRRMVGSMLGSEELDAGFLARLTELSEGNPFYLERLLEHLVQTKLLVSTAGRWQTAITLAPEQLPRDLRALVLRQLMALSPEAVSLARIGAVANTAFSLDLLQRVSGFEDDVLFAALEVLGAHQVVQRDDAGTYRFTQAQMQELLYESLAEPERITLHRAIAAALETEFGDLAPSAWPLEAITAVADHYMAAGVDDKTVTFALEAGTRLAVLLANADAARFLEAGLALARARGDEALIYPYTRTLGEVKRVTSQTAEAKALLTEAVALAETRRDPYQGRLLTSLAKVYLMLGDYTTALAMGDRAIAVAEAAGDRVGAARSLLTASRTRFFTGAVAEAIAQGERGLATAIDTGDNAAMGNAYALLGYLYVAAMPDRLAIGVEHLDRALSLLLQESDTISLKNVYNLLGTAQTALGDFQAARESCRQEQRLCFQAGLREDGIYPLISLSIVAYELGEFPEAAARAEASLLALQGIDSKLPLGIALSAESLANAQLGRLAHAQASMAVALALVDDSKNKYMETLVRQAELELCALLGQLDQAVAAGERLEALIRETGNAEPEGRMHALMAAVRGRQGRYAEARTHADRALAIAATTQAKATRARALVQKAWLALQAGAWSEAQEQAGSAAELARQIGAAPTLTDALAILGEAALATGVGDAEAFFGEMATLAATMASPLALAIARFGQAASKPYTPAASEHAREAQALLQQLRDDLEEPAHREAFAAYKERKRVAEGNFIAFSFRTAEAARPAPAAVPGLGFGGMW